MNKYRPPMKCAGNSENLLYLYKHLELSDPMYRQHKFEKIFEQILKEAYPKKNFQLINKWLNKLKANPEDWEFIFEAHGITVEIINTIANYPTDYLIGGRYINEKISLVLTKNWEEVFSSSQKFEIFASTIRAQFAHVTHQEYQDIDVDSYADQIGQYCIEMGLTAESSLKKLVNDNDRKMLSWDIKSKFGSDILDIYFGSITDFQIKKKFLRRVYDYIITEKPISHHSIL